MGDKTENKSPQKEQKQRTGKGFIYEVVLLDGEHVNFELDRNAEGRELFDKVCQHLDLIEKDYFGLQYVDERISNHLKCWLSPDKKIAKQKRGGPWLFDFALKFYPPDPTQLRESLTRWLVTLQTRRDILSGKLPATFLTQAMLGSYCVQADVGDYDPNEHRGVAYIRDTPFTPNQTTDLLEKIVELHKQHKGQTPDEAEINFLENAKKLSMYGVDLHAAQDVNNVDIMLGVCASGLQVYREKLRISRFVWPKILKISYKRKHFYIKVRPTDNSTSENTISFKLASHRLAKRLWKICVEHHAFFRLREAEQSQNAAMFPRLGSKFRYSGRTLYQTRQNSQILDRPDPYFERSQPARNTFAAPSNRSHSVDELSNRPDYWKDDMGIDRNRLPSDGQNRKDWKDDPNATERADRENMRPLGSEDGAGLEPGANRSMDGKDRLDRMPGEDDATLNRSGEGTMGLTPAELQKKAKEDEKERKKREKEEEKRRKKEEEDRKKAEKAAKKGKGKGDSAEDRNDLMAGGDNTEKVPGRAPGSYADQEGDPVRYDTAAPVGTFAPGDKDSSKKQDPPGPYHDGLGKDRQVPGKDGDDPCEGPWSPRPDRDSGGRDVNNPGKDCEDKDCWTGVRYENDGGKLQNLGRGNKDQSQPEKDGKQEPGRDGDKILWTPGKDGEDRVRSATDRDGDRESGKDGDKERRTEPDREGQWSPGKEKEDPTGLPSWKDDVDAEGKRWLPGRALLGFGQNEKDLSKKDWRDSDKHKDKKEKRDSKKDKSRKGSDKYKKDLDKKKDQDWDKHGKQDKDREKKGGLFGKFKKPKDSKSKLGEEEAASYAGIGCGEGLGTGTGGSHDDPDGARTKQPRKDKSKRASLIASLCPGQSPSKKETRKSSVSSCEGNAESSEKASASVSQIQPAVGSAYPGYGSGYGPGMGVGAGDMSGVDGEETWIDNKLTFEPIVPPKKETKDSLKSGIQGIDHTMPFFSPAATSTVGRPGKVPPPVPPKANSFDDSFNRTDVYKNDMDGIQETRVEHKMVLSSADDEDFDYDAALADAIRSVTEFNPDMSVERIECVQQIEEVKNK